MFKSTHLKGASPCQQKPTTFVILQYADLRATYAIETESYPWTEMLNEIAGFASLCFGISVLSLVYFYEPVAKRLYFNGKIYQLGCAIASLNE